MKLLTEIGRAKWDINVIKRHPRLSTKKVIPYIAMLVGSVQKVKVKL